MEYFVSAEIHFTGKVDDVKKLNEQILDHENHVFSGAKAQMSGDGKVTVILDETFCFDNTQDLIDWMLRSGFEKDGEDYLTAYQTCAECEFENIVHEDGKFEDYVRDLFPGDPNY